ncbi:MAG: hypothetical protein C0P77_003480 [Thermoanaerobacterales bacterium]|jgi:hypothetical protein|nr:hypothetical protein [Thermoanaerobacterales bacterium]
MSDNDNTERVERFKAEVAAMHLRDPATGLDRLLVRLGVAGLVAGPCFSIAAWFIAHGTRNPLQQRDAIVVGLIGVTLAVVGGALFVKGAMAGFLRFWMARLCYEQGAQADRLAAALTGRTSPEAAEAAAAAASDGRAPAEAETAAGDKDASRTG